jgi:hypothetical protein
MANATRRAFLPGTRLKKRTRSSRVCRQAALEPFDNASKTCGFLSGTRVSPDHIRAIAGSMREAAEDFLDNGMAPEADRPACAVVVEVDGKGAPLTP